MNGAFLSLLLGALPLAAESPSAGKTEARPRPLAATFVSSKEWMMRRAPVKEEEFIGDVRYWTYSRFVRADWALYRHDDETWTAKGNIRGEHTLPKGRGVFEAFGDKAVFDQKRRTGSLRGKKGYIDVVLTGPGGAKDYGRAGGLEWEIEKSAALVGGVRLWGERVSAWADQASYDWRDGTMVLSGGRPVLHKKFGDWSAAIKADVITALQPARGAPSVPKEPGLPAPGMMPRYLLAEGGVTGWLDFKSQPVPSLEP
ncbi:MAG: hypothetical protein HY924_13950 [Elusimicrobia bacterium]|nr:hypothetical protein [Elusimicrobiota bacterium]